MVTVDRLVSTARQGSHFGLVRTGMVSSLVLGFGCPSDDGGGAQGSTGSDTTAAETAASTSSSSGGTSSSSGMATGADTTAGESTGEVPLPARVAVTADWKARSLSVIDLDALASGARTRDEIVARTLDLSEYAPGPLQVELVPGSTRAVVSISPGFFAGFVGNLIDAGDVEQDGTLLVVDLETEEVTEIATMHVPMGIAITPDGTRAFTANYGLDDPAGSTLSVIDLETNTVLDEVEVGVRPEQVSLDSEGNVGLLNVVDTGAIRAFEVGDPAGTLSPPLEIGSDPSDVAFIPGTTFAVATNSLNPSNYVVLDVSDPAALVQVVEGPAALGSFYAVASIPGTDDVLLTSTDFITTTLWRETIGEDGTPIDGWQIITKGTSFPLGVALSVADELAFVPLPGTNELQVASLDGKESVVIPWQDEVGPSYVAVAD
ncbi:MAG: hypothetical protein AAF799_18115 [Myxococcota bacterium]